MYCQCKLKNIFTIFLALVFALGILITSVVETSAQSSSQNYQMAPVIEEEQIVDEDKLAVGKKEVDYFLAYPGILPDHFLYPVKMIRDRIWLWLTTDSLKKAEKLLLFADKRLGAGKALIEGNKVDLGITTLTKGEKYLQRAINQERVAKDKGRDTKDFLEKVYQASLKHEEVLLELQQKVISESRPTFDETLKINNQAQEQLQPLLE